MLLFTARLPVPAQWGCTSWPTGVETIASSMVV